MKLLNEDGQGGGYDGTKEDMKQDSGDGGSWKTLKKNCNIL